MRGHITRGRAAGTWYLRVELQHDGNGKRRQRRETMRGTKADAQRRLRDLLGEIEAGGYADAQRMTVAKVAQRWLASKEHRVVAKTYAFYASNLRLYIVPALGSLRVESLRPTHIEAAIGVWTHGKRNDREKGELSSRSVAHLFNTLRTMLRWAVKMRMLAQNAADAVDPPRFEAKEMHVVDAAGVTRLLSAAQETDLQAIVAVAIGTGLRRGELLALRWSDVDLDQRRLAVRRSLETVKGVTRTKPPKTARSTRTIALPPFVADVLLAEQRRQTELRRGLGMMLPEDGWIFVRADGSSWEPGAFSLVLPDSSSAQSSRTYASMIYATRSARWRSHRALICKPFRERWVTNQRRSPRASISTRSKRCNRTPPCASTRCSEMPSRVPSRNR
jgi:integrase